jgi:hypothetical protein
VQGWTSYSSANLVLVSAVYCRASETFFFLGAFAKLQKATISFVMSVRLSAWDNSASTEWILMKFYI